ncbi:hypothetical protein QUG28_17025 [Bacillus hominis]|uniref:hypothetical protein n=1 Tax=Bacillus hominis TaxID=2817478 RepID=UPI0025A1F112|nr:hypothetical protein [Bacillus hominis]MDM5434399.1 hypothetical protein [Bacillus hominis]
MGYDIDQVRAILNEVDLSIKLKTPKSTSVRWEIYTVYAPYKDDNEELAELRHTEGQEWGTQTVITNGEGLDETIFSERQLAAFKKIMDANPTK